MAETVTMPKLGFDMAEGTLVRWVIAEGQPVAKGSVLAEIETDKATVEVESNFDGLLAMQLVPEGTVVPVNTAIAIIAAPGEKVDRPSEAGQAPAAATPVQAEAAATAAQAAPAPAEEADSAFPGGVKASPVARRMAADRKIDLRRVQGTGPGGRVTRNDVEAYQAAPSVAPAAAPSPAVAAPHPPSPIPIPYPSGLGAATPADETIPVNRLRAAIGRRMVESKTQLPHFYVTHEYDMAPVMELRKQVNALLPDNEKLSVNDFILKAAAITLRQFPNLNASLQGNAVLRHGQINMGVAVAVEGGLLTIVCRDADRKPLRLISQEVKVMAGRARDGKVRPDDIEGSTFSVSNLGMFDVENFLAIINPPEAAILAISSAREVPVVKNGQVVPGWRMKATLSVDHRISDGAEAARFMQAMAPYLEEPLRLML
jgi:pyruvate dehydrogenase E2 component (dihydrolipoamide acetyltransferase)